MFRITPGFFNLNNDDAPGNAAMYDMVTALQFVKKHIHHFGGNPDLITIAGQSAGSVAVTHLLLSPLTRDENLFHRAIAMSGSAMLEWGTITAADAKSTSLDLARSLGCYDGSGNIDNVANCLRGKKTSELVKALEAYQVSAKITELNRTGGDNFFCDLVEGEKQWTVRICTCSSDNSNKCRQGFLGRVATEDIGAT